MIPYFCRWSKTYLELEPQTLLCSFIVQTTHNQSLFGVTQHLSILKRIPLFDLVPDSSLIPFFSFRSHSLLFFFLGLTFGPLHQIFIGDIKHRMNIFASRSNRVKRPALRLHRYFDEGNFVSSEQLKHIRWHLWFHLMKLFMLRWRVHLERPWKSVSIGWLTC